MVSSLIRKYSPSLHYPDSSVKDLDLAKWNALLETLSIGEGTELELRGTPTHKLLERLHPILTNQDRGVSLEYGLQNSELYEKCNALITDYSKNVGRQSSVYLARTVRLGNKTGTIDLNNPDAVYLRDFVADFKAQMSLVRSRAYIPVSTTETGLAEGIVTRCNIAETEFLEAVAGLSTYPDFKVVAAWRKSLIDYWIGSKLMQAVYTDFSKVLDETNSIVGESHTGNVDDAIENVRNYIEYTVKPYSVTTTTPKLIITIRLYPTYSGIAYVCPQPVTTQLSHSRFIQTKTPAQNIRVTLQNNIALNTLDTQWYGFYTELFSNIIEYGNPAFTLRAGHDRIDKCYLTEPLTFAKRNDDPMQTFTLGIISSSTGINVSDSGG